MDSKVKNDCLETIISILNRIFKYEYNNITKCLTGGTSLMIYGVNKNGSVMVVSVANFVIFSNGVYINWIGTNNGTFQKKSI